MSTQRPRQPHFSPTPTTPTTPKHFPCTICKKPTDQTCSLCRRVFYCSSEHQQIDWHMRHKLQCQGKILANTAPIINQQGIINQGNQWNTNQTVMYNGGEDSSGKEGVYYSEGVDVIERKANLIRTENQSRQFMGLFEQRLILRKRAVDRYLRLSGETSTNSNTNPTSQQPQQTLTLLQQLNQTSQTLLTLFKPPFTPILEQTYGITTSQFILTLDSTLDRALLAKYHLLTHKHQEVRRFLFSIHDQLPSYPNDTDARLREVYENVLKTVLGVSEVHCNDKVTEGLLARFVRVIERFDGVWEQIYAYFNMANWYLHKTYHHKAIRSYNHSLDLLNTHHKARSQPSDSSTLTKADLLYNMSLAQHCINDHKPAFDNMQESYRLRTKAIGKNSIQASHCLQALSRWAFSNKYWEDCLQYARECYRVRKLNSGNYPRDLERVEKLLESIYGQLKREKERSQLEMGSKPAKYYETLLTTNNPSQSNIVNPLPQPQPHQSFIKQLSTTMMNEQPQLIQPKVIITPEMAETYTSTQWEKLTKLLYDTDRLMEKEEFRRVIFQSEFTESLGEGQGDVFIRVNKVE